MRLCDSDIIAALDEGRIAIEPRPADRVISGVSIDLRLGHQFRVFSSHTIPFIDLSGSREQVNQAVEKVMGDEIYIGLDDTSRVEVIVNTDSETKGGSTTASSIGGQ